MSNTRLGMLFEISQLAQAMLERFKVHTRSHWKRLNSAIRYAHNNVAHLRIPKLGHKSIGIVGYSDASFENYDISSQLGRILLLVDDDDVAVPIFSESYKSRREARSVLSAEVIAFTDLFDEGYAFRSQAKHALQRSVPTHLLTDSKSLYDMISKGSCSSKKRIMLDIHVARQACQAKEISNIGFVRSSANLADRLTK